MDAFEKAVVRPGTGLKSPYMDVVTRPDYQHRWTDHEHPTELDDLLRALGADVIDYPLTTECCGGHMTQIGPETAFELIMRLVADADERGAHMMVTVCPMCQMNIDAYRTNKLVGTDISLGRSVSHAVDGSCFGRGGRMVLGTELVSSRNAWQYGCKTSEPGAPVPRKKDESAHARRWTKPREGVRK